MQHRRTDPACLYHRPPRTPWGAWWFTRNRGRACPVCVPNLADYAEQVLGIRLTPWQRDYLESRR